MSLAADGGLWGALISALPLWLQEAQAALLQGAHALGLVGTVDGQPAWPLSRRIAVETFAIDAALSRQWLTAVVCTLLGVLTGLLTLLARRGRWGWLAVTTALLCAAPWPPTQLWLSPAMPTSFHRTPSPVAVESVAAGLRLYDQYCAACHGSDGRADTPVAAHLPVWPPLLSGALLWKHAEGETYARVRNGMRAHDGRTSMPGFAAVLSPQETWEVLSALRFLASGQSLREEGRWAQALAAPAVRLQCAGGTSLRLQDWRGEPVQWVLLSAGDPWPQADPRLETAVLVLPSNVTAADRVPWGAPPADGCRIASDPIAVAQVVQTLLGLGKADAAPSIATLRGVRLLIDREGWVRAWSGGSSNGQRGWQASDLRCRADGVSGSAELRPTVTTDGLEALLRRMDADPVPQPRPGLGIHASRT